MNGYAETRAEAKNKGEKYYFTGKPCKRGHIEPRFSSSGGCTKCGYENDSHRRMDKPEDCRERQRKWRECNRDYVNERQRLWRAENPGRSKGDPEKRREQCLKWYYDNREHNLEVSRLWREKNREHHRQLRTQWQKNNPDYVRASNNRRRSRKYNNGKPMTSQEYRAWERSQPKICFYCGIHCADDYEVDHIVPYANGGVHQSHNLCIACMPCNRRKGAKDVETFMHEMKYEVSDLI